MSVNRNPRPAGPPRLDGADGSFASRFRNALARIFRDTPYFPGKQLLAKVLNHRLSNFTSDKDCLVETRLRDGSRLRLDLRSPTEWPAFWTGSYDSRLLQKLTALLPREAVSLDVGANIGFYSIPLGRRLEATGGRLYAVEPVPGNFARLVDNVALNRLEDTVQPLRLALGKREGTAELQRDASQGAATGNAVVVEGGWGRTDASAPMTTLDRLVESQALPACHLIKADIEGGEYHLLQGGLSTLRRFRPVVVCELNPFWMQKFGWSFKDLHDLAQSVDYHLFRVRGTRLVPAQEPRPDIEDVFLLPRRSG